MHLYGAFIHAVVHEEVEDFIPLVALELNDLAHFEVVDNITVAGKLLRG